MPHKDPEKRKQYRQRFAAENKGMLKARRDAYREKNKERINARKNAHAKAHPEQARARLRKWRRENPERNRAIGARSHLASQYGLTVEQRDEMVARQGGKCAICQNVLGTGKQRHIDHDHSTGRIRGILCSQCNRGLGIFKDDPTHLFSAIAYLADTQPGGIMELTA